MGKVYLVKSVSNGRPFAVKQALIRDEKHRKAFLAELQTWIDLPEHPNIVPCRFFRTVGEEILIFADFVEGGSLADWIAKGKLTSLERILDVAIQFAWGLHTMHQRGLIHQDVKPSNVLMTGNGVPKVTDFGLARARMRGAEGQFISPVLPSGEKSILVSSGGMTPAYASPEQRAGQPLSRKTDIWSWGVSVLDMFMGCVSCPHGGHIAAEVLMDFLESGQTEPGLPEMPEAVADVLRRCLAHYPAERWSEMSGAAETLIGCYQEAVGKRYARPRPAVGISDMKVAPHDRMGVEGVGWRDPREWLRLAYQAAGRDPAEAGRAQPAPAQSRKAQAIADLALYDEAQCILEGLIKQGQRAQEEHVAVLCMERALVHENVDDISGALTAYDRVIGIWERLVNQEGRRELADGLASAYMNKAVAVSDVGDNAVAVQLYDRAIAIRERLVNQEGRWELANGLAMAYLNKANSVRALGDNRAALDWYERAISIWDRLVNQEGRCELTNNLATTYLNKAVALSDVGDNAVAVQLYDRAIAIRERLVNQEGRQELADGLAMAYMSKANSVSALGDNRAAVNLYDRAIAIRERLVNQEGRQELANDLATTYLNKALAVSDLGDNAVAVNLYDRAIAIRERLVNQEGRRELADGLATTYLNKALAVSALGDNRAAVNLYDRAIAIRERLVNQEGRQELADGLAGAYLNKAVALSDVGDNAVAVQLYDRAIAIWERLVNQEGRRELANNLAAAYLSKANTLRALGDNRAAVKLYDQAIAISERLVKEGRTELRGDLAWVQLYRAHVVTNL
ncbi:MAG: serine/threonine-protein kinase, partial [bacterium]